MWSPKSAAGLTAAPARKGMIEKTARAAARAFIQASKIYFLKEYGREESEVEGVRRQ
jgi:hypothetical protein